MSTFVEAHTESSTNCNPSYQTNVNPSDISSNNVPAWGKKSPWGSGPGNLVSPPPCSLVDVMSEQLALELSNEEAIGEINRWVQLILETYSKLLTTLFLISWLRKYLTTLAEN